MHPLERKHVTIRIYGNVQRVFYRVAIKRAAEELNISGFTKNRADGTVHIEAEGDPSDVNAFIERCKTGSEMSMVKRIRVTEGDMKDFSGFSITA